MTLARTTQDLLDGSLRSLAEGRFAIRSPKELSASVDRVRKRFGNGQASLVTQDRVEAAARSLITGQGINGRQEFVLAHAMAQPVRVLQGKSPLQSEYADFLLTRWERQATATTLRASLWRGLFRSYMQAEDGAECRRLRKLLQASVPSVRRGREPPLWQVALQRHQGLLGDAPCSRYVDELLRGESEALDDLRAELDVPPASWFWRALRGAVLEQVPKLREAEFRARIGYLLSLHQRIPNSRDDVLAAVLSRYEQCQDRSRHVELLEVALEAWDSPQLSSNRRWGFVPEPVRQMVCGWLAQEDLEDFYRICKGASGVDERRLRFWLRFKGQMGYTQILLGSGLRNDRSVDVREFVRKKRGRLGELTATTSSNNAMLMQIGGWIFIEFSETGNAFFAFPVQEAPIKLGASTYSMLRLKMETRSRIRLIHNDTSYETWEQRFQDQLRSVGVIPDDGDTGRVRNHTRTQRAPTAAPPPPRQPAPAKSTYHPGGADVLAGLRKLDVTIVDNRSKGGAIWAYPNGEKMPHAELRALGMKFKPDKDGYYWP